LILFIFEVYTSKMNNVSPQVKQLIVHHALRLDITQKELEKLIIQKFDFNLRLFDREVTYSIIANIFLDPSAAYEWLSSNSVSFNGEYNDYHNIYKKHIYLRTFESLINKYNELKEVYTNVYDILSFTKTIILGEYTSRKMYTFFKDNEDGSVHGRAHEYEQQLRNCLIIFNGSFLDPLPILGRLDIIEAFMSDESYDPLFFEDPELIVDIDVSKFVKIPHGNPGYILSDTIVGEGNYGQIVKVSKIGSPLDTSSGEPIFHPLVAKIISNRSDNDSDNSFCLNQHESNMQEFTIAIMLSDLGIGPKVHHIYTDGSNDIMIMDQWDENVEIFLNRNPSFDKQIYSMINELITKMHVAGIVHRDIYEDNILCRYNNDKLEVAITDTGLSFVSTNSYILNMDRFSSQPQVNFRRNGKKCTDWQ
jgi:hypothetical protein